MTSSEDFVPSLSTDNIALQFKKCFYPVKQAYIISLALYVSTEMIITMDFLSEAFMCVPYLE